MVNEFCSGITRIRRGKMPWLILLLLGGAGVAYVVVKGKQQQQQQIMPPNQAIHTNTPAQAITNGQVQAGTATPVSAAPTSTPIVTKQPTKIVEIIMDTGVAIKTEVPIGPGTSVPTLPPYPIKQGRENRVYWRYGEGTWHLVDRQRNYIVPQSGWPQWLQI